MKTDELSDMTQKCLLCLNHQVQTRIPKQTAEKCIVVFLNIHSASIANHVIDGDIYHVAFASFVDEVEIIMEVLDDEAAPIKEFALDWRKNKKLKKLKIVRKELTRICIQGHEYSNNLHQLCSTQKKCKEWASNLVDWKNP